MLLPLQEDRAIAESCVHAWVRDQRTDRERYELIVLAPGLDPALEARVGPLLSHHDRRVAHDDLGTVRFPVGGVGRRSIALTCPGFLPRRHGLHDGRDLGLAVRTLAFTAR